MSTKRRAIAEVSFELLGELLELPAGCEIEAIFIDPHRPDVVQIRLVGAGWAMPYNGMVLPRTVGTVRMERVFGLRPEISWDLPA